MMAEIRIAQNELVKPELMAIDPPIAKSAKYEMPPNAAFATVNSDQRRKERGA